MKKHIYYDLNTGKAITEEEYENRFLEGDITVNSVCVEMSEEEANEALKKYLR